jgi:hypothetical protein
MKVRARSLLDHETRRQPWRAPASGWAQRYVQDPPGT